MRAKAVVATDDAALRQDQPRLNSREDQQMVAALQKAIYEGKSLTIAVIREALSAHVNPPKYKSIVADEDWCRWYVGHKGLAVYRGGTVMVRVIKPADIAEVAREFHARMAELRGGGVGGSHDDRRGGNTATSSSSTLRSGTTNGPSPPSSLNPKTTIFITQFSVTPFHKTGDTLWEPNLPHGDFAVVVATSAAGDLIGYAVVRNDYTIPLPTHGNSRAVPKISSKDNSTTTATGNNRIIIGALGPIANTLAPASYEFPDAFKVATDMVVRDIRQYLGRETQHLRISATRGGFVPPRVVIFSMDGHRIPHHPELANLSIGPHDIWTSFADANSRTAATPSTITHVTIPMRMETLWNPHAKALLLGRLRVEGKELWWDMQFPLQTPSVAPVTTPQDATADGDEDEDGADGGDSEDLLIADPFAGDTNDNSGTHLPLQPLLPGGIGSSGRSPTASSDDITIAPTFRISSSGAAVAAVTTGGTTDRFTAAAEAIANASAIPPPQLPISAWRDIITASITTVFGSQLLVRRAWETSSLIRHLFDPSAMEAEAVALATATAASPTAAVAVTGTATKTAASRSTASKTTAGRAATKRGRSD